MISDGELITDAEWVQAEKQGMRTAWGRERRLAREALDRYGEHELRCSLSYSSGPKGITRIGVCDCGFEKLLGHMKPEPGSW